MSDVIVGIDLGTTNSEIAAFVDGQVRVLGPGEIRMLPSCVGFSASGELLVGEAARNQQYSNSLKSPSGSRFLPRHALLDTSGLRSLNAGCDLRLRFPDRTGSFCSKLAARETADLSSLISIGSKSPFNRSATSTGENRMVRKSSTGSSPVPSNQRSADSMANISLFRLRDFPTGTPRSQTQEPPLQMETAP